MRRRRYISTSGTGSGLLFDLDVESTSIDPSASVGGGGSHGSRAFLAGLSERDLC